MKHTVSQFLFSSLHLATGGCQNPPPNWLGGLTVLVPLPWGHGNWEHWAGEWDGGSSKTTYYHFWALQQHLHTHNSVWYDDRLIRLVKVIVARCPWPEVPLWQSCERTGLAQRSQWQSLAAHRTCLQRIEKRKFP